MPGLVGLLTPRIILLILFMVCFVLVFVLLHADTLILLHIHSLGGCWKDSLKQTKMLPVIFPEWWG